LIEFDTSGSEMPFLVMEYVEGQDLAQHIVDHGPASPHRAATLVRQIAAALETVHARRIVHADVKPGNVMLLDGPHDTAKLLDFGVAHFSGRPPLSDSLAPTTPVRMLGTPAYMSPEQAQGRAADVDGRADQFALAALSYVLLTGEDPFSGDTTLDVLTQIVSEPAIPLAGLVSWRAEEVDAVLERALSKRPSDRYGTVSEFAAAFARATTFAAEKPNLARLVGSNTGAPGAIPRLRNSRMCTRKHPGSLDSNVVTAARR
jgi:serine/threonine protein kinase